MLTRNVLNAAFAAMLCLAVLAGCGRSADEAAQPLNDEDGILGFVPADTPFVFAAVEKMPDPVLDKLEASADSLYSAYETVISASMGDLAEEFESQGEEEQARLIMAMAGEFADLMQSDNLRAAGVPRGAQAAIYGVGLLPVFRLELANPVAFEAKLAEIESSGGGEMSEGSIDGAAYRYIGDENLRIVIAVLDDYFVATIVPVALAGEQLATVLGVNRPARNVAESNALGELAGQYGLTAYGLGYFDVGRTAAIFLDSPADIDAALLETMDYDPADLSDVCRGEVRDMAAVVPRVVTGYTSVTTSEIGSNSVIEVRSDLAAGLAALAAPVPGLGRDHGGLFSFGASVDVLAAREFVEERLAALEAAPFACEHFAGVQAVVAQGRQRLNQPVPPIVYGTKGFLAVIDSVRGLDFEGRQPPEDVDARLIVASDNAEGLLAMGAMFSPELAALDVQPDGRPVELPLPQLTQMFDAAWIALTESAIGLSIGESSPDGLAALLGSDPGDPPPSVSVRLDGRRYYQFMSEAVKAGGAEDNEEMPEELQDAMGQVLAGIGDMVDRIAVDVTLTARGIEIPANVSLVE